MLSHTIQAHGTRLQSCCRQGRGSTRHSSLRDTAGAGPVFRRTVHLAEVLVHVLCQLGLLLTPRRPPSARYLGCERGRQTACK